jgi:predicted glutamine amidotransferase
MCGIVGVAGDISLKDLPTFEDLLDVCQLRGRDSTGAVRVNRTGTEYAWAKMVGPPTYLKESRDYSRNISVNSMSVLIGHCRYKTIGSVDRASAHPYDISEKGIIGVHNGTLKNYCSFPQHRPGNTDSLTLYESIAERGPVETFEQADGAWACVWWDQNTRRLHFIRNKERSLWYTYSEDKRRLYWASEPWMFAAVSRREALWDGGEDKQVYRQFTEDILYTLEINLSSASKNEPILRLSEGPKIEKKPRPLVLYSPLRKTPWISLYGEKKGGEVANPFWTPINKEPPPWMTISARSTTTGPKSISTHKETSSTLLRKSSDQSTPSKNTSSLSKGTTSQAATTLLNSLKISRKKLSVVSELAQKSGSTPTSILTNEYGRIYRPDIGVDIRHIAKADMTYITDLRTGREYSEIEFKKLNKGCCCFCGNKISNLSQVAEIYDDASRFLCVRCVTPPIEVKSKETVE